MRSDGSKFIILDQGSKKTTTQKQDGRSFNSSFKVLVAFQFNRKKSGDVKEKLENQETRI